MTIHSNVDDWTYTITAEPQENGQWEYKSIPENIEGREEMIVTTMGDALDRVAHWVSKVNSVLSPMGIRFGDRVYTNR